jgi:hypothetical protein
MIKANEYREGILVLDVAPYDKVHRVDLNMIINALGKWYQYRGIPLTPEWMERCGFVRKSYGQASAIHGDNYWGLDGVHIVEEYISAHWAYLFKYNDGSIEVIHLHQLQNLYFALTSEELQIKMS